MQATIPFGATAQPEAPRRLVLATAFMLALAVWAAPHTPAADAQGASTPATTPERAVPPSPPAPPAVPAIPSAPPAKADKGVAINIGINEKADAAAAAADADAPHPKGERTIVIQKGDKTITLTGGSGDRDEAAASIGSLDAITGAMVVAIVCVVFLSPVIAIALILGYRMRKARMLNETMLKLAEKGIVPPAEVIEAAGGMRSMAASGSAASPLYEQAKEIRARTAWSDLRKGVVMGAIGAAVTIYSTMDDRSPNIIGLVLLFVGAGYVVLWWFEQRHMAGPARGTGNPPGSGGAP